MLSIIVTANRKWFAIVFWLSVLLAFSACTRVRTAIPPSGNAALAGDHSFIDLEPGWKLRIVVPVGNAVDLTRSAALAAPPANGSTITLATSGAVGFETSYYTATDAGAGKVKLKFTSAARTIDGQTTAGLKPLPLPLLLPRSAQHIRLLYHIARSSEADHRMALIAAKRPAVLTAFTRLVIHDPTQCEGHPSAQVFCTWVPPGTAVTPEKE